MSNLAETASALANMREKILVLTNQDSISSLRLRLSELNKKLGHLNNSEISKNRSSLKVLSNKLAIIRTRQFSLFDILGIENNESVHSNFLAWLLTPNENHGLGTTFTEKALKLIASKSHSLNIDNLNFNKLQVKREESGQQGRLDIRIFDPSRLFQCVIENKIKSAEGDRQTLRYFQEWGGYCQKEIFVFLSINSKQKPVDKKNYVTINYEDIRTLLLELHPTLYKTKFLIRNYLNTLEQIIMASKFQGFSEKSKLYFEYYQQIKDVQKAWEKDRQSLLDTVLQELTSYLSQTWKITKNGRAVLVFKEEWHSKPDKGISFWVQPSYSEASVDLYVYSMPYEFNKVYARYFKKYLEEASIKADVLEFKINLTGGSLSLKKTIPLIQENALSIVVDKIKEMIEYFENIIDNSVVEFKQKEDATILN
jgi:effector-binding domain-containing protein